MSVLPGGRTSGRDDSEKKSAASEKYTKANRHREHQLVMLLAALLLSIAIHYQTYSSMVQIWLRSDTFLHCALIFPISAYLIWRRRRQLISTEVRPTYPWLIAILAVSLLWWLCDLLGIQVGKQLLVVALLPLITLTVAGPDFARTIAFPLAYLLFAVPFGEATIPYLVDYTAFFTVEALQLSGIPVLREGAFFSIPSGNFEVAKACSGIRYILASLSLGTLYGYLIFRSPGKRLAFFVFALLLPIVANGFRAFFIVLLAHFSDMKIAVGVDHLIFGWIFFGLIMILMFWIGDRFRDVTITERADGGPVQPRHVQPPEVDSSKHLRLVPGMIASLVLVIVGPGLATVASELQPVDAPQPGLPRAAGTWQLTGKLVSEWEPAYVGATHELLGNYSNVASGEVDLCLIRYDAQRQGAELANSLNTIADPDQWRFGPPQRLELKETGRGSVEIREALLLQGNRRRLVWFWHEVGGVRVGNTIEMKLQEATGLLRLKAPVAAAIVVSAPWSDDLTVTRNLLTLFLEESTSSIRECLYKGADRPGQCVLEKSGRLSHQVSDEPVL